MIGFFDVMKIPAESLTHFGKLHGTLAAESTKTGLTRFKDRQGILDLAPP